MTLLAAMHLSKEKGMLPQGHIDDVEKWTKNWRNTIVDLRNMQLK